ncbi:MAG TPA: GTPase Era [Gemmatimonadales bacterium]|nr:GTPase Era [Gemmatimonadales bacterium]
MSRCAIVALAGAPNAGKSTLLNRLVGEPLAIVSPKPQTTRAPVRGILTEDDTQLVFVDPAGLLEPEYPLHSAMVHAAVEELRGADLVLYLHPLPEAPAPPLESLLPPKTSVTAPVITVYTKADTVPPSHRPTVPLSHRPFEHVISALTGEGIPELLRTIRHLAPEGPWHYPADEVGTQPLRFFAEEYVREAVFAHLEQELPYCTAVTVDEFRESESPVYIRATIAVERESQKPIVLGKGGAMIKRIGTDARRRLEALLGGRVRLDLWVKVWPKWRKDPAALARLGLPLPPEKEQ